MPALEIQGDVTGQVAGGDIHNHGPVVFQTNSAHVTRIKIVMQPGPEHINDKKKAELKSLVTEVVRLEGLLKREPKGFAAVWNALDKKCHVSSYHLILNTDFAKAEKYLREWIGRLSSAKSAHTKDPGWRNRKFSYIFTNVKQIAADAALRSHLLARYGDESLKGLSDTDLEAVYHLVAGWKKVGHAPGQAKA